MGLFDLFRRNTTAQKTVDAPMGYYLAPSGQVSPIKSGVGNAYTGMYSAYSSTPINSTPQGYAYATIASVWAFRCVEIRAQIIQRMGWKVVDIRTKKTLPQHPLMVALNRSPQRLMRLHERSHLTWGESFLWPRRNAYGYSADLTWLNNLSMDVDTSMGFIHHFWYMPQQGGKQFKIEPERMAFIKTDNPFDDLRGLSRIESVLVEVGIDKDIARATKAHYANDMRLGLMLFPENDLPTAQAQQFMDYMRANFQGPKNAGKPVLFPRAIKEAREAQRPPSIDDVELRESVRREICAGFGVPLSIAGAWDDAQYQSAPEQRKSLYEETIIPRCDDIKQDWNQRVMPFFDDSGTAELDYDPDVVLAMTENNKEKVDIANSKLTSGGITRNQYLIEIGETPGDASSDVLYVPSGVIIVPVAQLAQQAPPPAPAVQAPAQPAPTPAPLDTEKSTGREVAVMLDCGNDADLISLQKRLQQAHKDDPVEWNAPDSFHVTLAYAPSVDDKQLEQFKTAVGQVAIPAMTLSIGSLHSFDNLGNHALHFRLKPSADLQACQKTVYEAMRAVGIELSSFSDPGKYIPHITMGYTQAKPKTVTFSSKISVQPSALYVNADKETVFKSPINREPQTIHAKALEELDAWEKKVKNGHAAKGFKTYLIRSEVAGSIETALATSDKAAIKAAFDLARAQTSTKAIQATRLDFENAFDDVLKEALAGTINRTRWATITRQMIRTFGFRAFVDGLRDGGVDDDPDESEQDTIADMVHGQSEYVTGLGAALFKDEVVTDAMADQKASMWFNKSIQPFYQAGLASADSNSMYQWVLGRTEDHCSTCAGMDGQIHRLKTYNRRQVIPQSDLLECGGFQCDCHLVKVVGKAQGAFVKAHDHETQNKSAFNFSIAGLAASDPPPATPPPRHDDRFNFEGYEIANPSDDFEKYDDSQPRDDSGEWSSGGGGGGGSQDKQPDKKPKEKPKKKPKPEQPSQEKPEEDNRQYREFGQYPETLVASAYQPGAPKPTDQQHEAMEYYRDISGNAQLNVSLRKGEPLSPETAAHAKELDGLLGQSKIEHDSMLYRGIAPHNPQAQIFREQITSGQLKAGSVLSDKGYASTTLDAGIANGKFAEDGGVVFKIKAKKGSEGLYMNTASDKFTGGRYDGEFRDEKEVLLPRNSQYRIGKVEKNGNQYVVEMTYEGVGAGV